MNREAAKFCRANDIILYALLRNTMFVMQPFDIGIFSEMKMAFKNKCRDFITENMEKVVNKASFPGIFQKTWEQVAMVEIAQNAF